jgi:hypothetical protein
VNRSGKRRAFAASILGMAAALAALTGCRVSNTGNGDTASTTPATTPTEAASPPTSVPKSWTMPNLVGAGLQQAQDRIQALTHNEIFFTSSHDVSGQGRHQILDRDWRVCSQNVASGTSIGIGTKIDFGVVKTSEACP